MTPAEERLFRRTQRYAATLTPDLAAAVMRAFARLRDQLGGAALARAIETGQTDAILAEVFRQAVVEVAFAPVREQMRRTVRLGFTSTVPDLPRSAKGLTVSFNVLTPQVVEAIRTLETRVLSSLEAGIRETVRQAIEAGLQAGQAPRTIAMGLREVIGLAPNQELAVRNLRAELDAGKFSEASKRALLDTRFNLNALEKLSAAERAARIDRIVATYRKTFVAHAAETTARTATLDAFKLGQHLAWQDAIDKGIVDPSRLLKRWVGVMDSRERPTHVAMEGDTVPFDVPYSNGQMIPGEDEFNCRCVSRYIAA